MVSPELIQAFREGISFESKVGVNGYPPLIGFQATLLDGDMHPVDSKKKAFELAGRYSLREAGEGNTVMLEPIMKVSIETREEYIGRIASDIANRRGSVSEVRRLDDQVELLAEVPLSNLFNYVDSARALTSGNVGVHYQLSHYDRVPKEVESKILNLG